MLPKSMVARIKNINEYLDTGKIITLGVRPEDIHQDQMFLANSPDTIVKARVEVIEKLGAESLLYCVFGELRSESDEIESLVEDRVQIIAKVDSRSTTAINTKINLGIDLMHTHMFDKETELSILEGEGTKAYVPEVELERLAKAAEEKAAKEAAKAAKAAAKENK
jgi:hypothetical protein